MPGTVGAAIPAGTLPASLATKFTQSNAVLVNINEYHDGSSQRLALVTSGRRTWTLSKRLSPFQLRLLFDFLLSMQGKAFYFYNPIETLPPYSRNALGASGQYLVRLNSDLTQLADIGRSDLSIELVEVVSGLGLPDTGPGPGGGLPNNPGGGTTPPPAFLGCVLTISDTVSLTGTGTTAITDFTGETGVFPFSASYGFTTYTGPDTRSYHTFTSPDGPPGAGWIAAVSLRADFTGSNNYAVHVVTEISMVGDATIPLYTFHNAASGVAGQPPPPRVDLDSIAVATFYPPIRSTVPPTFNYQVTDGTSTGVPQYDHVLGVVELTAQPASVLVGWPTVHYSPTEVTPSSVIKEWIYSGALWDDLQTASVETAFRPSVQYLAPWAVAATQALTFSTVKLRLVGMSSYTNADDGTPPAEVDLVGNTCTVKVKVDDGSDGYTVTLGATAVTIHLNTTVSTTVGNNAITIQVVGASIGWYNSFNDANPDPFDAVQTPPFPLISVDLT